MFIPQQVLEQISAVRKGQPFIELPQKLDSIADVWDWLAHAFDNVSPKLDMGGKEIFRSDGSLVLRVMVRVPGLAMSLRYNPLLEERSPGACICYVFGILKGHCPLLTPRMIDEIEDALERRPSDALQNSPYWWHVNEDGCKRRAAFCREQAAKAREHEVPQLKKDMTEREAWLFLAYAFRNPVEDPDDKVYTEKHCAFINKTLNWCICHAIAVLQGQQFLPKLMEIAMRKRMYKYAPQPHSNGGGYWYPFTYKGALQRAEVCQKCADELR